jgi:small-conductance mechanosensitive channel
VTLFVWLGFAFSSLLLLLQSLSRHEHWVQPKTVPLLDNMGKLMIVALGGYALCLIWGVNATAWLTSAGILGIAIGFAAKDTLGNLFSGIFILADAPYKIGDFIILDNAERGQVTNIGLRSTRILTRDDIEIIIPNAVIAASKIVNETGGPHPKERIRVPVGVAYGSDVDRVVELLEKVALDNEAICRAPEPRARFRQFGTSSLDFELLCWIEEPVLRGQHRHELNMAVYKIFAKNGIQIPFPQRDIHIRTDVNRAED